MGNTISKNTILSFRKDQKGKSIFQYEKWTFFLYKNDIVNTTPSVF